MTFDSTLAARVDVDVVETDAQPADDLERRRRGQQLAIDFRAIAHDERIGVFERGRERIGTIDQALVVQGVVLRSEPGDRRVVHEFADDDAHPGRPKGFSRTEVDVAERLELERIAERIEEEHRRLLARQPAEADVRLDDEFRSAGLEPGRERFPLRQVQDHSRSDGPARSGRRRDWWRRSSPQRPPCARRSGGHGSRSRPSRRTSVLRRTRGTPRRTPAPARDR
jgi:hypothetical protein